MAFHKAFNWVRLLEQRRIPYVWEGPNVKRGNFNIQCPFCGTADKNHHMGIDPDTGWWGCWRNTKHRGKSPIRLIMALLRCSYERACEIAGIGPVDAEGFQALARDPSKIFSKAEKEGEAKTLELPEGSAVISSARMSTLACWDYLNDRGVPSRYVDDFCDSFGLVATFKDRYWKGRVIFPYYVQGRLLTWTGRAIRSDMEPRYKALSSEQAVMPTANVIYNYDWCIKSGASTLLVVEGPVDATKASYVGLDYGVAAVAISTASPTPYLRASLEEFCRYFDEVVFIMDPHNEGSAVMYSQELKSVGIKSRWDVVPPGEEDIGAMSFKSLSAYLQKVVAHR